MTRLTTFAGTCCLTLAILLAHTSPASGDVRQAQRGSVAGVDTLTVSARGR
jgi:hypothetical protein